MKMEWHKMDREEKIVSKL